MAARTPAGIRRRLTPTAWSAAPLPGCGVTRAVITAVKLFTS